MFFGTSAKTNFAWAPVAATVIGGANLMGGAGTAYGAIIGSALLEVIRNALLMAGIDSNWQGAFVGAFIVLAVLLGMLTSERSAMTVFVGRFFPKRGR
jgi:ribose transport system permease protein